MIRKQILRTREHFREILLRKVKAESEKKEQTFNIAYYQVFQNVRDILQELHIVLTQEQEHQNV